MAQLSAATRCRCCGHLTLDEPDSWEICPVCFWEDDPIVVKSPEGRTGANKVPLVEAKANYDAFGAIELRLKQYVRAPSPEEAAERSSWLGSSGDRQ